MKKILRKFLVRLVPLGPLCTAPLTYHLWLQGESLDISTAKSIEDCVQQCRVKKPDCTAVTYLEYTKDEDNLCILFKTCPSVDSSGVGNSTKLDCSQSRKCQTPC